MLTKNDYEKAVFSQSACNLSGIVQSFAEIISRIWEEARATNQGTDFVNQHPISRLFAEQIYHLTVGKDYFEAHAEIDVKIKELS